jgi:hypothetical protein
MTRGVLMLIAMAGFSATQFFLGGPHVLALSVGYALGVVTWALVEALFFKRDKSTMVTP